MINYTNRLLFFLMLAALLPAIHAAPVTWFLNGVTFSDGSRAFGSSVYDTATGLDTNIDIVTTPGTGNSSASARVTDLHYTIQSPIGRPQVVVMWTDGFPIAGATGLLQWGFTTGFSVGGKRPAGPGLLSGALPGHDVPICVPGFHHQRYRRQRDLR